MAIHCLPALDETLELRFACTNQPADRAGDRAREWEAETQAEPFLGKRMHLSSTIEIVACPSSFYQQALNPKVRCLSLQ